jgi:predicted tellurium resistance membrane protein TerC
MDWLMDPTRLGGICHPAALEIVLGIDNVVFISILAGNLGRSKPRPAFSAWAWRW